MSCCHPLCDILTVNDAKIVTVALEALENILASGLRQAVNNNGVNPYTSLIEECGGVDKLEALQRHDNQSIYRRALNVLKVYFEAVEEDQEVTDSNAPPGSNPPPPPGGVSGGLGFAFAPPASTTFHF